ncbi:hypothetical protein [Afipia felis]
MTMTPVTAMPAPMPAAMPVVMAIPAATTPAAVTPMTPLYFFDLRPFDILWRRNSGIGRHIRGRLVRERRWRRRHGLCRARGHDGTGGQAKSDFQEVPSFHVQSLSLSASGQPCRLGMNVA